MAKPRNPRRVVLGHLRNLNRQFRYLTNRWDQRQTVYDKDMPQPPVENALYPDKVYYGGWRPRRDDEKAELSPTYWAELYSATEAAIVELRKLSELAAQEYYRLQQGGPQ